MKKSIRFMLYTAMMTAVISVSSLITVPSPVPFTMQTFGVFLALSVFGGKIGLSAIGAYILIGVAGMPVFAGFGSGIGHILGPTGGYIIGFLFTALIYLIAEPIIKKHRAAEPISMITGLIVCYIIGTVWFCLSYMQNGKEIGFFSAVATCVLPFVIPDILKLFVAYFISLRVKKYIRKIVLDLHVT